MSKLIKQSKCSHSNTGRSMDTAMAFRTGGEDMPPSVLSMNRREKERQMVMQKQQQASWAVCDTKVLQVPTLATMAPSFTKAADEGVEAYGGTKMGGQGYTTLIGMVPTDQTNQCIEDDYELISSFRPYRYDALNAARQAAMRENAAPHPDLLRHLEPTLGAVCPHALVDVGALPPHLLEAAAANKKTGEEDYTDPHSGDVAPEPHRVNHGAKDGTYPFLCQGRYSERKRLPGVRQPALGQYHPRFNQIETRVVGGYVQPRLAIIPRGHHSTIADSMGDRTEDDKDETGTNGDNNSVFGKSVAVPAMLAESPKPKLMVPTHGQNVKGSSMFLSRSERKMELGTAAPDVFYWPYPDVRSTTKRAVCPVKMDVGASHRRRDLTVAGVPPAGAYNVAGDIANMHSNTVRMSTTTGRETHWIGKKSGTSRGPSDYIDVDAALGATRPKEKIAFLPKRSGSAPATGGEAKGTQRQAREANGNTVSIERDLNFPPSHIGTADHLSRVRAFERMVGRDESHVAGSAHVHDLVYEADPDFVKKAPRATVIHPRAPGHGALHNPNPTELGEIPSMRLVRPSTERTTAFGVGSSRPDHLLPLKDLSYDTAKGHHHIEPRVRGDPMIGTLMSRQKREKIFATKGCGANVMYDNLDVPVRKIKSVPDFDKQITKETQFCGHRIVSERWERKHPRAPGPGFYDVSFKLVEK